MKSKLFISNISMVFVILFAGQAFSWDFPLSMDVIAIKFNHGEDNSALNIRKNYSTDITAPEFDTGAQKNEEFAFIKTDNPDVYVKLFTEDFDTGTSLTIDAVNTVGGAMWELADTEMYFNGSGYSIGSSNYVKFDTDSGFPTSVQDTDVHWSWRIVKVGNTSRSPYSFDDTEHNFYVVHAAPESPWTSSGIDEPWTDVLEYACSWADGETTESGCISELTDDLYNCGINYSPHPYSSHSNDSGVFLNSLLPHLENPSQNYMDCRDFSHFVNVLAAVLGIECNYKRITEDFDTNYIYPAGLANWDTYTWEFHQISWYNSYVVDAAAMIDNDADPTSSPHTAKLAKGNVTITNYLDKLTEDSVDVTSDNPSDLEF